ncbi:hypothetical protein TNCV_3147171 [Trichonephila clavipes]|nr:hypothetical protein TNCV_3147171 [Trichonephila clavipes]
MLFMREENASAFAAEFSDHLLFSHCPLYGLGYDRGRCRRGLHGIKDCRDDVQDKTAQYFKGADVIAHVVTISTKEADSQLCDGKRYNPFKRFLLYLKKFITSSEYSLTSHTINQHEGYWQRPSNFEHRIRDEDDTCDGTPLSELPTPTGGLSDSTDLTTRQIFSNNRARARDTPAMSP